MAKKQKKKYSKKNPPKKKAPQKVVEQKVVTVPEEVVQATQKVEKPVEKVETPVEKKTEKKKGGFFEYIKGVRSELKKVVWPTKDELAKDTVVVICSVTFFSLMFWGIDSGFLALLKSVLNITL